MHSTQSMRIVMKKICFVLVMVFSGMSSAIAQRVLVVDNGADAPGGELVFSEVQAAIDAAEPGDSILVVGHGLENQYADVVINGKSDLTITGAGFNPEIATEGSFEFPVIENLDVIGSSKITVSGLWVEARFFLFTDRGRSIVQDVRIEKSRIGELNFGGPQDVIVTQCFVELLTAQVSDNGRIAFSNNVIKALSFASENMIFDHNFFLFANLDAGNFVISENNRFTNNVFARGDFNVSLVNSLLIGNFVLGSLPIGVQGNTGSDNVISTLRIEEIYPGIEENGLVVTTDLSVRNAAIINAAPDGTDFGPTGGLFPYSVSVLGMPSVMLSTESETVSQNRTFKVSVSTKAN